LLYAKKVDPDRKRTFGVMTKIDIMDKGTDACDYLSGKQYKLEHGYIGVKCRSQQDNNKEKTIKEALEDERKFFRTHPAYKKFADSQGTEMLAIKLSKLLEQHIQNKLPAIEKKIEKNYKEYTKILKGLGESVKCENDHDAFEYLTRTIDDYTSAFKDLLEGDSEFTEDTSYCGGSKIYQIFKFFCEQKIKLIDPLQDLSIEQILVAMRKAYGIDPGLFIPEEACKRLIMQNIDTFKKPSEECCKHVYDVLDQAVSDVMEHGLGSRLKLREFLHESMEKIIDKNYKFLLEFIKNKIEAERGYINYDDDNFKLVKPYIITDKDPEEVDLDHLEKNFGLDRELFKVNSAILVINKSVKEARDTQKQQIKKSVRVVDLSDDEEEINWNINFKVNIASGLTREDYDNIMYMRRVIHCYFEILKREFKSTIPKYIVQFLVRRTTSEMRTSLQSSLHSQEDIMGLVEEDTEVKTKREIAQNCIKQLNISMKAIKSMKRAQSNM